MDSASFRAVLAAADVVLDTQPWSGGNTTLDALAAGTPVATWPGRFMRGRQTAAMLAMAGVGELVAAGPGDYVELAMRVAGDRDMNQALRERIRAGREALFGRREPVSALEDALLAAAAGDGVPML